MVATSLGGTAGPPPNLVLDGGLPAPYLPPVPRSPFSPRPTFFLVRPPSRPGVASLPRPTNWSSPSISSLGPVPDPTPGGWMEARLPPSLPLPPTNWLHRDRPAPATTLCSQVLRSLRTDQLVAQPFPPACLPARSRPRRPFPPPPRPVPTTDQQVLPPWSSVPRPLPDKPTGCLPLSTVPPRPSLSPSTNWSPSSRPHGRSSPPAQRSNFTKSTGRRP